MVVDAWVITGGQDKSYLHGMHCFGGGGVWRFCNRGNELHIFMMAGCTYIHCIVRLRDGLLGHIGESAPDVRGSAVMETLKRF